MKISGQLCSEKRIIIEYLQKWYVDLNFKKYVQKKARCIPHPPEKFHFLVPSGKQ
jgi:hypothetical protein